MEIASILLSVSQQFPAGKWSRRKLTHGPRHPRGHVCANGLPDSHASFLGHARLSNNCLAESKPFLILNFNHTGSVLITHERSSNHCQKVGATFEGRTLKSHSTLVLTFIDSKPTSYERSYVIPSVDLPHFAAMLAKSVHVILTGRRS